MKAGKTFSRMGQGAILFLTVCLLYFPTKVEAQGVARTWRIAILGQYSMQDFAGINGANFSQIQRAGYSVDLHHVSDGWMWGLGYFVLPSINVKPFTLSTNVSGNYTLEFQRIEAQLGYADENLRFILLYAMETLKWSGSPELGAKDTAVFHPGVRVSFDVYKLTEGGGAGFSVPIEVSYFQHPERKYEFSNFPSDTATVKAGTEIALGAGVAIDF